MRHSYRAAAAARRFRAQLRIALMVMTREMQSAIFTGIPLSDAEQSALWWRYELEDFRAHRRLKPQRRAYPVRPR